MNGLWEFPKVNDFQSYLRTKQNVSSLQCVQFWQETHIQMMCLMICMERCTKHTHSTLMPKHKLSVHKYTHKLIRIHLVEVTQQKQQTD